MGQVELYKCALCFGCKPLNRVIGIKPGCYIKAIPTKEAEVHVCKTCIIRLKDWEKDGLAED
jgi:hypothetical protein